MELRHLRHFVAVAEHRNFTRAAAELHVVQSALSVSVRALERDLDARLFDRTTHSVELTDAGAALLPEARRTLAAAERARDAVAGVGGGLRGSIRIGIMHSLSVVDLAGVLTAFHRRWPDVQLIPRPAQGGSAELCAEVASGRLDVAFAGLPLDRYPDDLDVTPLATEEMVLLCPPDEPGGRRTVPLADLAGRAFVDPPTGWGNREATDRLFAEHGLQRRITVEVADIPNIVELVRAGFGLALMPPSMITNRRGLVVRRVAPAPRFSVSLITARALERTAATEAFVDLATSSLRAPA